MNSPVHHHSIFKHFCRICNKGFLCGRALGGHMRAHGMSEDTGKGDEEDAGSDWDDKLPASDDHPPATGVKRMYELRTNPNRLKSCRSCENCGKEFVSWKSFLEHGKCNSDDADSRVSPLCSDDGEDASASHGGCNWSKRKRSFRAKVDSFNSSEEEDLANCLMMLSNSNVDPPPSVDPDDDSWGSPPPPPTHDYDHDHTITPPLFSAAPISFRLPPPERSKPPVITPKGLFECKACKKVFNSHQALGGHRASHKKVKGCFASRLENLDEVGGVHEEDGGQHEEFMGQQPRSTAVFLQLEQGGGASLVKGKSKVHECSICHRVFSSGQALGGHKRCHWITSNSAEASSFGKMGHFNQDHVEEKHVLVGRASEKLDLNLPARGDELGSVRRDPANPLSFEVSTEIYLQSWLEVERKEKHFKRRCSKDEETGNYDNVGNGDGSDFCEEGEEEDECNKVKLAKLCDLKDVSSNGTSSPWLQVGIGSGSSSANGRHES